MTPSSRRPAVADFFEPVIGCRIWRRGARDLFRADAAAAQAHPRDTRLAAPDYFEPVVGWRVWRVVRYRGRYLLASLFVNVAWPPGAALEAACHHFIRQTHRPPEESCHCGIYATQLAQIDWTSVSRRPLRPFAIGRVSLWGNVIEAERGWRAERAYPLDLVVPRVGVVRDEDVRMAEGLGHYGIPVDVVSVPTSAELVPRLAVEHGEPLPQPRAA